MMKTHDNRVLFSKALLKAATCLFLTVGAGVSPVFALPGTAESMKMEITQQTVTVSGVVKEDVYKRQAYHNRSQPLHPSVRNRLAW